MDLAIPGYIEGRDYVETFDSPQKTREKIVRKVVVRHEIGEAFFDTILDLHGQNGLDASQCSYQAGIYDTISLVFVRDASSVAFLSIAKSGGGGENFSYSADSNAAEHALEELSNYKISWNHNLYECVKDGQSTSSVPAWAETDTDEKHADGVQYLWANSQPNSAPEGSGWREVLHRQKKADAFLCPDFVIHEKSSFRTEKEAESAIKEVGKLAAPKKTYGRNASPKYWLITRSSVSNDGGLYVLQTDYQYSDGGWDEDLYS